MPLPSESSAPPQRPPVTIRPAGIGDLDAMAEVQRRSQRDAAERFRELTTAAIVDDRQYVVVAQHAGDGDAGWCVGWAAAKYYPEPDGPAPSGHYLMGIAVDPEYRRKGVARALIAARIGWIRERADAVSYIVNAGNAASLAAHREWPFEEVARGEMFRGITFAGGVGVLLTANLV